MAPRDESYAARREYCKAWSRKRYQERGNKCAFCWKPHPGPRSYCKNCAKRVAPGRAAKRRAVRAEWKKQGLCMRCGGDLDHSENGADISMDPRKFGRKLLTCFACRVEMHNARQW